MRQDPHHMQLLLDMPLLRMDSKLRHFICATYWMRTGIPDMRQKLMLYTTCWGYVIVSRVHTRNAGCGATGSYVLRCNGRRQTISILDGKTRAPEPYSRLNISIYRSFEEWAAALTQLAKGQLQTSCMFISTHHSHSCPGRLRDKPNHRV